MRGEIPRLALVAITLLTSTTACGDDVPAALPPSAEFAAHCAVPRVGTDPGTGKPYPDQQGTTTDEKTWVRSWIDEYYLWYREVPNYRSDDYATAVDYFAVLKTDATTASGAPKDHFHFTYPSDVWTALSQSGVEAGYGATWAVIAPRPPRRVVVAYTEPNSPATTLVSRGAEVLTVDGVDVVNGSDVDTINAGLFPSGAGESHTFEVLDIGAATSRTITMVSADVTGTPVKNVHTLVNGAVGYLQFDEHVATAESELASAIQQLKDAGVQDVVLDIRYNGGGYLAIASELAYMIAGPASAGHDFDLIQFNDKYPDTNPIEGGPNTPTPFYSTTVFAANASPLPSLGLQRVFVLTGPNTCSASEAVINGLRGIDVDVIQIGSTTCGKPYGFYPQDNCGTTYFAIQFQGVNDKGFGDYADGFSPDGSTPASLPGCAVADDFTHALGDPAEARLAAAIQYRESGTCPPPSAAPALDRATAPLSAVDGRVIRPPWRENLILRPR
jgi:carboxyl-terminal processing protease